MRRIAGDLDVFWPTPLSLVTLRTRVGGGLLDTDRNVGILLGHRLYTGGPYVVRGWVDRGILPPGSTWKPGEPRIGGNTMFHATVEPRFHVHPHLILTPFVDAGSTWNDPTDVTFDTLRWSTGGGARVPLIVGVGHLLFAYQASDPLQDSGEPAYRIHLTLESEI